jgi:hypothetical protein
VKMYFSFSISDLCVPIHLMSYQHGHQPISASSKFQSLLPAQHIPNPLPPHSIPVCLSAHNSLQILGDHVKGDAVFVRDDIPLDVRVAPEFPDGRVRQQHSPPACVPRAGLVEREELGDRIWHHPDEAGAVAVDAQARVFVYGLVEKHGVDVGRVDGAVRVQDFAAELGAVFGCVPVQG